MIRVGKGVELGLSCACADTPCPKPVTSMISHLFPHIPIPGNPPLYSVSRDMEGGIPGRMGEETGQGGGSKGREGHPGDKNSSGG